MSHSSDGFFSSNHRGGSNPDPPKKGYKKKKIPQFNNKTPFKFVKVVNQYETPTKRILMQEFRH